MIGWNSLKAHTGFVMEKWVWIYLAVVSIWYYGSEITTVLPADASVFDQAKSVLSVSMPLFMKIGFFQALTYTLSVHTFRHYCPPEVVDAQSEEHLIAMLATKREQRAKALEADRKADLALASELIERQMSRAPQKARDFLNSSLNELRVEIDEIAQGPFRTSAEIAQLRIPNIYFTNRPARVVCAFFLTLSFVFFIIHLIKLVLFTLKG